MRARCPECGYLFALHERALGRELSCPSCANPIRLPSREDVERAEKSKSARPRASEGPKTNLLKSAERTVSARVVPEEEFGKVFDKKGKVKRERKKKEGFNHEEAWDITPMVDVAFLLLIFFMVTASFSIQKVLRTARQASDKPSRSAVVEQKQDAQQSVTVQVDEQDGFAVKMPDGVREEAFSKQELILLLVKAKEDGGEELTDLTVEAHEESTHGAVVAAFDAGRAAKFSKFKTVVVEQF